ncbi:MAG: hypothetical protein KZQ76_14220 [Candidatus Thiodiazotropha sp. (ex Epidulcina cf. delphinae)]|nr:hypothetical protein [Candidatus Thiodiazotropha sp. (ex Epidulcina cf. delphinae)]
MYKKTPFFLGILFVIFIISLPHAYAAGDPFHNGANCVDCHDVTGTNYCGNTAFIACDLNTPNSGVRPVRFFNDTGPNSLADGDTNYDGPCEVCHTNTKHHRNDGAGLSPHFEGQVCTTCHLHSKRFEAPFKQLHKTHLYDPKGSVIEDIENKTEQQICMECHERFPVGGNFADGLPIATTTACDTCHSPEGLVNGSAMAKANTFAGIYEADGLALKPGNEKWCVSCHDEDNAVIKATPAPNIAGKDLDSDGVYDYGYYVTGHKIDCLECHDPLKNHIDGEHRTYDSSLGNHQEGYRLRSKNGRALIMPRPLKGYTLNDAPLCTACHPSDEVLGAGATNNERKADMSHTNFISRGTSQGVYSGEYGLHARHYVMDFPSYLPEADSDYDGARDSNINCTTCHNVHGARNSRMIRSGELMNHPHVSNPDPGFDFIYYTKSPDTFTAEYPAPQGTYKVYAWITEAYNRAIKVPYIINTSAGPVTLYLNQKVNEMISLNKPAVLANDGRWNMLGTYTFGQTGSIVISTQDASGVVVADAVFFEDTVGQNDLVVEHAEAVLDAPQAWKTFTDPQPGYGSTVYNGSLRYVYEVLVDPYADIQDTIGLQFQRGVGGFMNPEYCGGCHSQISNYGRVVKTYPMVLGAYAVPNIVTPSTRRIELIARVMHHNNSIQSVTIDLSPIGINDSSAAMAYSGQEQLATLDGGSTVQGRDLYNLFVTVPNTISDNLYRLEVTAIDTDGVSSKNHILLYAAQDGEIVIDDSESEFIGNWYLYDTSVDQFGPGLHYKDISDGSAKAVYRPNIPENGEYYVFAWWSEASAQWRPTNAPFVVNHARGSETLLVDQTTNGPGGGKWNCLGGPYQFNKGTDGYIEINDNANHKWIVADAMKFVPAGSVASCQ